jgi:integrase
MTYRVHTTVFSTGERFPVLLHQQTFQPVVLVTRYVIDRRRETKQSGTIERDVRVLKWLYEWANQTQIDLDLLLRTGNSLTSPQIVGLCRYLRARRTLQSAGGINANGQDQRILSPHTFNSYVAIVEDFLIWAAGEYIPQSAPDDELWNIIERGKNSTRRVLRSLHLGGKSAPKQGLTHEQINELRAVTTPGAQNNPFKRPNQFRNHLIIELMLASGIRRGELLKLKLGHLPQGPKTTLTLERSPDDIVDPRKKEPEVKTLGREIPIPKSLAKDLWKYATGYRRRGNHPYLFTSHRDGEPLNAGGVNWIFKLLVLRCFPSLEKQLHPHTLRHTFNDKLRMTGLRLGWSEEKLRKAQTYLNGWTEGSVMPEIYSRRSIQITALELAEQYQRMLYV